MKKDYELNARSINEFIITKIQQKNVMFAEHVLLTDKDLPSFTKVIIRDILHGNLTIIEKSDGHLGYTNIENKDVKTAIDNAKKELTENYFIFNSEVHQFLKIEKRGDIDINVHSKKDFERAYTEALIFEEYIDDAMVYFDRESYLVLSGFKANHNEIEFVKYYFIELKDHLHFIDKNDPKKILINKIKTNIMNKIEKENIEIIVLKFSIYDKEFEYKLPKNLAYAYVMSRYTKQYTTAVSLWHPLSPMGLKMNGDDPYHSDLWIYLGFPMNEAELYGLDSTHNRIFYYLGKAIHEHMTNKKDDFLFLSPIFKGKFRGKIVDHNSNLITDQDILILPNANATYEKIARKAGLVIVEQGGQLSHIVLVSKEDMLPIILINNASSLYHVGEIIEVNYNELSIKKLN